MILEKLNAPNLATIPDLVENLCFSVSSRLYFSDWNVPVNRTGGGGGLAWLSINIQHEERRTLKSSNIISSSRRENYPSKMYNVPKAERNTDKKFPQNLGLMMAKNLMFKQI